MVKERFAARLRELREAAGLSRKELAERAGFRSEGGIRDLEQGLRVPAWDTVLALAKALGVSCEAFAQEPATEATEPRKPGRPRKVPEASEPAPVEDAPVEESAPRKRRGRPSGK